MQSLITTKYPEALFCAIETTGDGAVNVQSRLQMYLFKARQKAEKEYEETLKTVGLSQEQVESKLKRRGRDKALYYPKHTMAGTASNHLAELD